MSIQCGISFNRIRMQQRGRYDKVMESWSHGYSGNWIKDFEPNVQSPFGPNWVCLRLSFVTFWRWRLMSGTEDVVSVYVAYYDDLVAEGMLSWILL